VLTPSRRQEIDAIPGSHPLLYHGSSAPHITRFTRGISGYGEHQQPLPATWLASEKAGAADHARYVCAKNGRTSAYLYHCRLARDTVIADAMANTLPDEAFARLKARTPLPRRLLVSNNNWYHLLHRHAFPGLSDQRINQLPASVIRPRLISLCRDIGIDVITNPITHVLNGKRVNYNEARFGTTYLALNPEKICITECERIDH
jgi:hypothetical protein